MADFKKPSVEEVAWVFEHLLKHLEEGGTFRQLIISRMGYGPDSYVQLIEAGGMEISNALDWASTMHEIVGSDDTLKVDFVSRRRGEDN